MSFLINIQYNIKHVATVAESIVASAAPSTPRFNVYMNIGSIIIFSTPVNIRAIVARFTSPSALNSLDNIPLNISVNDPSIMIAAYGFAYVITDEAPITINGISIDSISPIITPCSALLSALSFLFAPIYREMREFAPAPNPFAIPPIIINNGVTNPIAASGSDPSPATHTLSTMLYTMLSTSVIIIGHAIAFIAILGSPLIRSTLSFFSLLFFMFLFVFIF